MGAVRAKVTRNGQVSLPAELRQPWGASSVLVIDRGDYAIVRPIPEDAIAPLRGAHSGPGPTTEDARKAERQSEADHRPSDRRRALTVLDGFAVLSYLRAEPCTDEVADLLRTPSMLTSVNAAELLDQLVRVYQRDADGVHADIALLATVGMQIVAVTADQGLAAGRLRARHYHRLTLRGQPGRLRRIHRSTRASKAPRDF